MAYLKHKDTKPAIPFKKTGLLTTLSVHEIEYGLCRYYGIRKYIIVPNVSWGFFAEHEADLVVITQAGYLTEIEIKRSWRDFLEDFKKNSYHNDNRIAEFYYCVPECMAGACKDYLYADPSIEARYGKIGLLSFDERGDIRFVRNGRKRNPLKLTAEEVLSVARLGVLRFWDVRHKYDTNEKDEIIARLQSEINFLRAEFKAVAGYDIKEVLE